MQTNSGSSASLPQPSRGELWWADLDPVKGRELGMKARPVLVVSVDLMNKGHFQKVIVVPSTTQAHQIPCHTPWTARGPRGSYQAYFCCEDVRAISVVRLGSRINHQISAAEMAQVEDWLRILMNL